MKCKYCHTEIKEDIFRSFDNYTYAHEACYKSYLKEQDKEIDYNIIKQHAEAIVKLTQDNNSSANRRARWILKELEK